MSQRLPPVPPANRSNKGPGDTAGTKASQDASIPDPHQRNLDEQGRQGNIKQNTTNQGLQQDR